MFVFFFVFIVLLNTKTILEQLENLKKWKKANQTNIRILIECAILVVIFFFRIKYVIWCVCVCVCMFVWGGDDWVNCRRLKFKLLALVRFVQKTSLRLLFTDYSLNSIQKSSRQTNLVGQIDDNCNYHKLEQNLKQDDFEYFLEFSCQIRASFRTRSKI